MNTGGVGKRYWARYERYGRAKPRGGGGELMALLSRGAVGDVANGVDGLVRRAAGDDDVTASERSRRFRGRRERVFDGGEEIGNFDEASGSGFAALGHFADRRSDEADAVVAELRHVAARRGIEPHARVHRRSEENGLIGREQNGGCEVVGVSAGHARHQVGGRRCNDDQIGIAGEPDVADFAFVIEIEEFGEDAFVGQRRDRERRDELVRGFRHNDADVMAALSQTPDQVQAFVGRDAAADDQKNAFCR